MYLPFIAVFFASAAHSFLFSYRKLMDITFDKAHMINLLEQMVRMETPSHDKAAVDKLGSLILDECRCLGGEVIPHPQTKAGDHIEARFFHNHPSQGKNSNILLLCHMDTVFPLGTLAKIPYREAGDKIFGPGVSDMKGGIAVTLSGLSAIIQNRIPSNPVTVLFTSDEETGSSTSQALLEKLARESSLVLVLEPGMVDGAVKTWRKGVGEFTVTVKGRAAHAGGDHQQGRNAIEEMAHQVLAIQKMTDYEKMTTVNVGVIQGGIASNVVPDEARIEVDLRVMQPSEAERIITAMHALQPQIPGTAISVSGGLNRPPMPYSKSIQATFEQVRQIASRIGIDLKASGTGGASDANFVAALGIPVLDGMGPAGGEYHSEREYIYRDSLSERARLLVAILTEWKPV
jgi:glutamate carboxypeptidase